MLHLLGVQASEKSQSALMSSSRLGIYRYLSQEFSYAAGQILEEESEAYSQMLVVLFRGIPSYYPRQPTPPKVRWKPLGCSLRGKKD